MSKPYDLTDPLLRPGLAAKMLGITTETLRRWIAKGVIQYVEVGPHRHKRIRKSQVDLHLFESHPPPQ